MAQSYVSLARILKSMRIIDEQYWDKRREHFSKEVDCLFDWIVFFYLFFFPFIIPFLVGGQFQVKIDRVTILPIVCFVAGGGIGFQMVKMKMAPILMKISYLFPLGMLLIMVVAAHGGEGLVSFFFYGISYSGGFLLGDRFNYILWQHQYIKTLPSQKRDHYLLGRIRGRPFLVIVYLLPIAALPYGVKLIYDTSLATEGQLLLIFVGFLLALFVYKAFLARRKIASDN